MRASEFLETTRLIKPALRYLSTLLTFGIALFAAMAAQSAPFGLEPASDWKLKKDKDGIQIFTQKITGVKHLAVKAEATVEGLSAHAVIAVILDAEACPNWADLCKQSYVHSKNNDYDYYVYTENDLPSPVKNRDALTRVQWQLDDDSDAVLMRSIAVDDILEDQPDNVRIKNARIQWIIEPTENGVKIQNWALIDPVGIPSWISNRLLVSAPFKTLRALIEEAKKSPYAEASSAFYDQIPD